jgi:Flp pilus assembly protein TadG
MNAIANRVPARQRGASLVEFVIVVPFFALLIAGIFEVALMYRTKALVHAATFEAAQQGALNNALQRNIDDGFAQGMMPMYLRSRNAAGVAQAYARARAALVVRMGRVQILSPSRDVFNTFRETRMIRQANGRDQRVQVIPNDNLMWRTAAQQTVTVNSQRVRMNVQDANVLKVRSYWCYRLLTPVLDEAIWRLAGRPGLLNPRPSDEQIACNLIGVADGNRYIAMTSSAVTRMQSPVYVTNLP